MTAPESAGGLVVRVGGDERVIEGRVVRKVLRDPVITAVPGAVPPLVGASFVDDEVVVVLGVGSEKGPAVLCDVDGERVLLTGLSVLRASTEQDHALPPFDAASLLAVALAPR